MLFFMAVHRVIINILFVFFSYITVFLYNCSNYIKSIKKLFEVENNPNNFNLLTFYKYKLKKFFNVFFL